MTELVVARGAELDTEPQVRWRLRERALLATGLVSAVVVRFALLGTPGFRPDLDTFVLWAHDVATKGLAAPYQDDFILPPVLTYVWGVLAALVPTLRTAVDASDPSIRAAMKVPASLADIGLSIAVAWSLRDRPRWAVAAGLGVALHPVLVDDSAWWGQNDALYVLPAFIAYLFARAGRPIPAAIALAMSVMTKPQALPFLIPFGAFALRRLEPRRCLVALAAFVATITVVSLPFIVGGGLIAYARNATTFQFSVLNALSLQAWNLWWLVQMKVTPGGLAPDTYPLLGPLSARGIGLALTVAGEVIVFVAVWRGNSARHLALGLACSTLVAFSLMTAMHERYSIAALVFLAPLLPDRRILVAWIILSIAIALNVLAAAPPVAALHDQLSGPSAVSVVGSIAILAAAEFLLWSLARPRRPRSAGNALQVAVVPSRGEGRDAEASRDAFTLLPPALPAVLTTRRLCSGERARGFSFLRNREAYRT